MAADDLVPQEAPFINEIARLWVKRAIHLDSSFDYISVIVILIF